MTNTTSYRYLFGPLPSRRFGRSLGVDLIPFKTCLLNCRFCQLGEAPTQTERREYAPIHDVLEELRDWVARDGRTDVVTLAGSGEPTLHRRFGDVLRWSRDYTPFKTLLISNGALFSEEDVRAQAAAADVVKVSLHAWDQASFERVTRADPTLRFDAIMTGYAAFRQAYQGELRLEVFIVPGFNDTEEAVGRIAALAGRCAPDRIDLNTAVRPPADASVRAVGQATLERLAALFVPPAHVPETVVNGGGMTALDDDALVALLRRHPGDVSGLAAFFGEAADVLSRRLDMLARAGRVQQDKRSGYWQAVVSKEIVTS